MSDLLQIGSPNERPRAPKASELNLRFSETTLSELNALLTHYPDKKSAILPALWMAQREYGGFLSGEAIAEAAHHLSRSYAEVEGVATFYSMYNTAHAVGKHMIEVCTCLSCQICDAYPVAEYLQKKLGIGFGETTADGMFTLHEVECLNACDRAPLIQVGDQYHGPVNEAYLDKLLEDLKSKETTSNFDLADSIVQVHLASAETPWRTWQPNAANTYYKGGESFVKTGVAATNSSTAPEINVEDIAPETEPPVAKLEQPKEPFAKSEQAELEAHSKSPEAPTDETPKPKGRKRIIVDESA